MRTTGLVACLLALAACGHGSAPAAVAEPAALSAAPLAASPAPAAPTAAGPATAPASSAAPIAAAPTSAAPTSAAPASAAPASDKARAPGLDVDGDGIADTVTTRFLDKRRAVLDVHLGSGKSLTSKAFTLYAGDRAGTTSGYDIDGNHRDEVFVEAPGGDGVGYDLFQLVGGTLIAVPAPKGQEAPYLYLGGGRYYESTFRCTGHALVQVKEAPAVASTASLPADPPFRVTVTTYRLVGGKLSVVSTRQRQARDRAASQALLADRSDGCGTRP